MVEELRTLADITDEQEKRIEQLERERKEMKRHLAHQGWSVVHDSTAVWTVAPMIIHVKRVTMHSYPG